MVDKSSYHKWRSLFIAGGDNQSYMNITLDDLKSRLVILECQDIE